MTQSANTTERRCKTAGLGAAVGVHGLANQRVFISRSFPENARIVLLDDDIDNLKICKERRGQFAVCDSTGGLLRQFVTRGFEMCKTWYIFGPNCCTSEECMHPQRVSRCAGLVSGSLFGYVNRHAARYHPATAQCEDQERSILHYISDKIVLRFQMIRVQTACLRNRGGLNSEGDRTELLKRAAKRLARLWPELGRYDTNNSAAKFRCKALGLRPVNIHKPLE